MSRPLVESEALLNRDSIVAVGPSTVEDLVRRAESAPKRRFRLCLHRSPSDRVNEMVTVLCKDTYVRPHRHPEGKTESYHVLQGQLTVLLFDDRGNVTQRVDLAEPGRGKPSLFRLAKPVWHMPVVRTEHLVMHEVFQGPFDKESDVEYSSWSPDELDEPAARGFLDAVSR